MERPIVQMYTGEGKGKTTAALGLALRASGHGMKTLIIQFLKTRESGERKAIEKIPEIDIESFGTGKFIVKGETSEEDRKEAKRGLERAEKALQGEEWDLLVLDELNLALYYDLVSTAEVLGVIEEAVETEMIITGRKAKEELIETADLVSEVKAVKHPYDGGLEARKGIEY